MYDKVCQKRRRCALSFSGNLKKPEGISTPLPIRAKDKLGQIERSVFENRNDIILKPLRAEMVSSSNQPKCSTNVTTLMHNRKLPSARGIFDPTTTQVVWQHHEMRASVLGIPFPHIISTYFVKVIPQDNSRSSHQLRPSDFVLQNNQACVPAEITT